MRFQTALQLAALSLFAVTSPAATVTWNFSGVWDSGSYQAQPPFTPISGSMAFNSNAPVTDFGDGTGFFQGLSFAFTVGTGPGSVAYTVNTPFASVYNNWGSTFDQITFGGAVIDSPPQIWDTANIYIRDNSQTWLSGVQVPTSVPVGAIMNLYLFYDQGTHYDLYTITSLTAQSPVPEPAAFGLLALGLAGIALRRRARS